MRRSLFKNGIRKVLFSGICAIVLTIAGCAHQPQPSAYDPPGFWYGLLHGFLIPFSFIGSLFTDVRIYAFPNSGAWYDFGYFLGAAALFGGASGSGRSKRSRDEEDEEEED